MLASAVSGFFAGVLLYSLRSLGWYGIIWLVTLAALFLTLRLFGKKSAYVFVAVFLITAALGATRTELTPRHIPDSFVPLLGTTVSLEGTVVADPEMRDTSQHIVVEVEREEMTTRVLANVAPFTQISYGDSVRLHGKLETPEPFETDGNRTFAYDLFLAKDGIFATMPRASLEVSAPRNGFSFFGMLFDGKHAFAHALNTALPEPESALASGILVGGKQGLGRDTLDAFTAAGLLQIVVLSGYNVMIVAEAVRKLFSFLPKVASLSVGAFAVALFVLAAGAGSSAVRAGIMALIALYARATGRTYDALRGLVAALIVMCLWSPLSLVFDPGLQLSALATFGLIIGTPLLESRLIWLKSAFLRDMVATTIAAQVAVLPLLLYQSGNLSLVSFIANIATMPVIPAAMLLSFVAALIAFPLPALAPVAGFPAFLLLAYVVSVADIGAALPLGHFTIPAFSFAFVLAAYAALWWCVVRMKRSGS